MSDKKPIYIKGVGWRYPTEHRMTRWPDWKDSHLPGTYMFTLNINGGQKILGRLEGSTTAIRQWMSTHHSEVQTASNDPLYYRHATLGTIAMPFVLKGMAAAGTAASNVAPTTTASAVETATNKDGTPATTTAPATEAAITTDLATTAPALVRHRFDDVAPPPVAPPPHRKTHFPLPALSQPDAPHIVLSPLGERVMQRAMHLTIAGRTYGGYGNMFLLKEPDRLQVFCHRNHPVTREPYHLTQDFYDEKADILNAASNGAVIVTPGISPGETDIMWSVLEAGGSVINIQKDEIPISPQWHPKKEYRLYCSRGQMLVLAVHDLPHQTFYDRHGQVIPTDSKYARFHLLNLVAAEICTEGIEHACMAS